MQNPFLAAFDKVTQFLVSVIIIIIIIIIITIFIIIAIIIIAGVPLGIGSALVLRQAIKYGKII